MKIVGSDKDVMPQGGPCLVTVAVRPQYPEQNLEAGCRLVEAHAMALDAARRDPALASRLLQTTLGISEAVAKEAYENLTVPTFKQQLGPASSWTMTNENAALSEKLLVAGRTMFEAKSFTQPIARDTIWKTIDSQYVQ